MSAPPRLAEILRTGPVIAVVTIERAADAVPVANALRDGGIRVLEVTLRSKAALTAIEAIAQRCADVVVGAGTLRRAEDLRAAAGAGARFLVSPGFTPGLHAAAREVAAPWLPGVATASEVLLAQQSGYELLKFFPAAAAGGPAALSAYATVFPEVAFCPTGGITAQSAQAYLALPNVCCVGGTWVAPRAAIDRKDWPAIQTLAAEAGALGKPQ
jgi:2-dehydro-3-deoxyphosphogluconate aldolase / (4S)-4-hydroxy-2-oxoglutarate aldolase